MAATGIETAFRMLVGRWKMVIIFHLFDRDVLRFSELQRAIPGISEKMLIQQLRDLERDGIVERTMYPYFLRIKNHQEFLEMPIIAN